MTIEALLARLEQMEATIEEIPGTALFDLGSLAAIAEVRSWVIERRDAPSLADIERGAAA